MKKEEENEAKENKSTEINKEENTENKKMSRKLPSKKIIIAVVIIVIIAVIAIFAYTKLRAENVNNAEKPIGIIEVMNEDQIGGPVVGQKYSLKNEKGHSLGEVETGSDGKIMFYSVPVGEYSLEAVNKVEGYNSRVNEKKVTVYSGEKTMVNFVNDWQGGYLSITVVDDTKKPIENATIEIYDKEGYVYDKITTDEEGKAGKIFEEYGTYYLKDVTDTASRITDTTLYEIKIDEENKTFNKTLTQERYK